MSYDIVRTPGSLIDLRRLTYAMTPAEWWAPYQEWAKHLHVDADPWQEREVRKLWAEHGAEKFQGLDLFGVCG